MGDMSTEAQAEKREKAIRRFAEGLDVPEDFVDAVIGEPTEAQAEATLNDPGWEQGCAFPDGVVHDHGHASCHAATAVKTAQQAVMAFLQGVSKGNEVRVCENPQCRVAIYTIPASLGRNVPICPGCYGSPQ